MFRSTVLAGELPWGAAKIVSLSVLDHNASPGQYAALSVLLEFVTAAERKLQVVAQESLEKQLNKSLQRGEDVNFDNILRALNGVSEHCLPSVLKALIAWHGYQHQYCVWVQSNKAHNNNQQPPKNAPTTVTEPKNAAANMKTEPLPRDFHLEKRSLASDYLFCLVLIEILPQLHFHPTCGDQVFHIITLAFQQFKFKDPATLGCNYNNCLIVAETYAEVIGVLSTSDSLQVQRYFSRELAEMKRENPMTMLTKHNIMGITMGMKFFRIKTNQVSDLEMGISFLHELGHYYLEVKHTDIKHSVSGLLVEILLPLAAQVKTETNIPSLISFVDKLYTHTLELANRKQQHKMAAYPLLTCLLCISQTKFFLNNWQQFLTWTLASLRNRDSKMSRVALESLYRLLWVYIIRIGGESNTATNSRLQSICGSLFPKGNRSVVPRDAPLNIFVKIIHFIAQQKLDFAFKEIIFDLLCCGKQQIRVYPERMNIGIRALMVIADGLQQKEGPPGMPRSMGPVASGTIQRYKKTYITRPLTADVARSIGLDHYYAPCRKAFDAILRKLDTEVGRPLMMTTVAQSQRKEPDELLTGETKPKLDLFRTCIAAVPRLLPDGMSNQELIDLLARMTIHLEEEFRGMAGQTLQNLMGECAEWRQDIVHGYLQFFTRDVQDTYPTLLDNSLRLLLQLMCTWKSVVATENKKDTIASVAKQAPATAANNRVQVSPMLGNECAAALHCVEGLALVMLCQARSPPRKIAVNILKEIRAILSLMDGHHDKAVMDVLDAASVHVVEKYMENLSPADRASWLGNPHLDFSWLCDKIPGLELDNSLVSAEIGNEYMQWDQWSLALSGFAEQRFLIEQCSSAVTYAWPVIYMRLNACYNFVDPSNPQMEARASLLRSSKSKATAPSVCGESLSQDNYLSLWQKYLVMSCALAPPPANASLTRSFSPCTLESEHHHLQAIRSQEIRIPRVANVTAVQLFQKLVPTLRWEQHNDMRDVVVWGLGSVNQDSIECLLEEMAGKEILRDCADRKQENVRRRKRRDLLRLQLIRLIEVIMFRGTVHKSPCIDESGQLKSTMLDIMNNARQYLESDTDRDLHSLTAMRLHFSKMVALMINSFPVTLTILADCRENLLPNDLKQNLFLLFTSWCSRSIAAADRKHSRDRDSMSPVEQWAVEAMCAVLSCGPIFEPNKSIGEDGYLYGWLEALLTSQQEIVCSLSEDTLTRMLDYNDQNVYLLYWTVDQCYKTPAKVADKCFRSLATIFCQRDYPCDVVPMLCLTLMYSGYPVASLSQMAVELLQLLEQRFLDDDRLSVVTGGANNPSEGVVDEEQMELSIVCGRSQIRLSQHLADEHPQLTMDVFSEVSSRLETARPARRAAMLMYLLPWMRNMELQDPNLEPAEREYSLSLAAKVAESRAVAERVLKGEGWGSAEGTQLILNNLLHITVQYGNEHGDLIERLWDTLVHYWPNNLRIVLRYLFVMSVLSPDTLLPFAKRIAVYLVRANPERMMEELMTELQTNDTFKLPLERSEMRPYYRWVRRNTSSPPPPSAASSQQQDFHTRRHVCNEGRLSAAGPMLDSGSEGDEIEIMIAEPSNTNASLASLVTLKADTVNKAVSPVPVEQFRRQDSNDKTLRASKAREHHNPYMLPQPAFGGHYSQMEKFLPPTAQPISPLHRNNLALIFLSDFITADVEVDWTVHLPLLLHMSVLGLDSARPIVYEHCKRLLVNLIVAYGGHCVPVKDVASVLLTNQLGASQLSLASTCTKNVVSNNNQSSSYSKFDTVSSQATTIVAAMDTDTTNSTSSRAETPAAGGGSGVSTTGGDGRGGGSHHHDGQLGASTTSVDVRCRNSRERILNRDVVTGRYQHLHDMVIDLTAVLTERSKCPLWANEDITARNWRIGSADQLSCFVSHVVDLFCRLLPCARIEVRWAQTAVNVGLNCSNRHLAGRSFQIFRALNVAPTSRTASDILSRLAETAGELNDDMQGYVTEILLTLQASVLHIEAAEHTAQASFRAKLEEPLPVNHQLARVSSPTHARSTSYTTALLRRSPAADRKEVRNSMGIEDLQHASSSQMATNSSNLPRSKSALTLKSVPEGQEEHVTALSQLFWIAVSMLDTDMEHEYLLALHFLDKLIDLPSTERKECVDRLERMVKQLPWNGFPGVVALLLKGCVFASSYDLTLSLLARCLPLLDQPIVDGKGDGFGYIVIAALPYLVLHFDTPTALCCTVADALAEHAFDRLENMREQGASSATNSSGGASEHPLDHLSMMLRQYSKMTFSRDVVQWARCVVKHLTDASLPNHTQFLILLAEMLDRSAASLHLPILHVMFCVFNHIDLGMASVVTLNADVMRAVSRHIQGPYWREASRIIKLAVYRSSSLKVPGFMGADGMEEGRRELPGRTVEFNIDTKTVATFVGHRDSSAPAGAPPQANTSDASGMSPRKVNANVASGGPSDSGSLRRQPNYGQARVREHLVNLLNASGLKVGLPKSPSVIFSQSSQDIPAELPSSAYSSSGDLRGTNDRASTPSPGDHGTLGTEYTSDSFPRVFKEFDFLEAEHDSMDTESADSCFNWLSTMRPRSYSNADDGDGDQELSPGGDRPASVTGSAGVSSDRTAKRSINSGRSHSDDSCDEDDDSTEGEDASGETEDDKDDVSRSTLPPNPVVSPGLALIEQQRLLAEDIPFRFAQDTRPLTPSTKSASRLSLTGSLGTPSVDFSAIGSAPFFNLECTHHATGQIEELWTVAVQDIMTDVDGGSTAMATLMFTQLYREGCVKVSGLLRDACHYLSMSEMFRDVSSQFMDALDVLMRISDCPYLFVTAPLLRKSNTLQKQKFALYELREHYDAFLERKEHCIRTLNSVKSGLKLALMGGGKSEETSAMDQEIELCRWLHKLFFQLLMMIEVFHSMMLSFSGRHFAETTDMSAQILAMQRELLCAVRELSGASSEINVGGAEGTTANSMATLVQFLRNKQYKTAIQHLRVYRNCQHNKLEVYGCCEDEDVEVLLLLYCRAHADAQPNSYAVVGSESSLAGNCQHLKETNLQLSSIVRNLTALSATTSASRSSRISSVTSSHNPLLLQRHSSTGQIDK